MGSLRKTLLVTLVWFAAGVTALAGTPYFLCRCADGSVKPLGLALFADQPCCHTGTTAPSARPQKATCPHCRARRASAAGPQLSRPCCHRTAVQPAVFSAPNPPPGVDPHLAACPLPAPTAQPSVSSAAVLTFATVHDPGRSPPPTDRVIVLQHFLI